MLYLINISSVFFPKIACQKNAALPNMSISCAVLLILTCLATPRSMAQVTEDVVGSSPRFIDLERVFAEITAQPAEPDQKTRLLMNTISNAEDFHDWDALEMLAWYGYQESSNPVGDLRIIEYADPSNAQPDILQGQRLALRFLGRAAKALAMKAFTGYQAAEADPDANVETVFDKKGAGEIRAQVQQTVEDLIESGEFHQSDAIAATRVLVETRRVARWSKDRRLTARWEEQDGDQAASFLASGFRLPKGLMPDDNYYRAAKSVARNSGDLNEVKRLLSKIDTLPVRRESSSFHASALCTDFQLLGEPEKAFDLARDWFFAHPDEVTAEILNLIAGGAHTANLKDPQEIRETLGLLRTLDTKYAELISKRDEKIAGDIREEKKQLGQDRALHQWEQHLIESQIAYAQVMLADAINDPELDRYAERFVTDYPQHPGVPSVLQILNAQNP